MGKCKSGGGGGLFFHRRGRTSVSDGAGAGRKHGLAPLSLSPIRKRVVGEVEETFFPFTFSLAVTKLGASSFPCLHCARDSYEGTIVIFSLAVSDRVIGKVARSGGRCIIIVFLHSFSSPLG